MGNLAATERAVEAEKRKVRLLLGTIYCIFALDKISPDQSTDENATYSSNASKPSAQ